MGHQFLVQAEFMFRIIVAVICGLIVGYERENRCKEAGIRTHAIVAMGAALIMIVSKYGFVDIAEYDGSRVAAQIVSGIGFLGAGIIFIRNNAVSGLTTAAGIWATSGIGMAIGSGLYGIGIYTTVLIVLVQYLLHKKFILNRQHRYEKVEFTVKKSDLDIGELQEILMKNGIEVMSMEIKKTGGRSFRVEMGVSLPASFGRAELVRLIVGCECVNSLKC